MKNFTLITDTPGRVASFLESRGIIKQTLTRTGETQYVGVLPGLEWIEVPNPIQTDPGSGIVGEANYVPPTYDTRHVYLVKFAHESEGQKAQGFYDWIIANSGNVTAPANYKINGEPAGDALKVNGQNVWLTSDRPERFGVWQ